jgi:protein O-mannosyl-transferase
VKKSSNKIQTKKINNKREFYEKPLFLITIILCSTFIAFFSSLENGFTPTWDDNLFVTDNVLIRHLDFQSLESIFTTPIADAYVPLPVLSFAVEYHFFRLNPFPYHISNLVLYLICTLLVFHFLRLLKLDNIFAALGALFFGIHPMHVESVAWITERKDLLFGLFYLTSLIMYIKYIRSRDQRLKYFVLCFFFFILALFSRFKAVTLPISLLLIDYYTERPLKLNLIFEKIPYVILSLVFGIAGIILLNKHGTLQNFEISKLSERIFFGLYALSAYMVKFFAPFHLSAVYPYPRNIGQTFPLLNYLIPILLLLLAFFIYRTVRHTRAIVFGTLFFLFNIIFLLQIFAAGDTYLSDRYSFIPYVGFCFIAGWSMEKIFKNNNGSKHIIAAGMSMLIIYFIFLTFNRCKIWKNDETLWTDAIEKYPNEKAIAYNNRGFVYWNLRQWDKAIVDCSKAIELDSNYAFAYNNRGIAYWNIQQWERAKADFSKTIEINPKYSPAYSNRGNVYGYLRQWEKSITDCSKAIELDSNYAFSYNNRGIAYLNLRQWEKAIADYSRAIEIDPQYVFAYNNRGNAYGYVEQWEKAIADYSKAIEIDPNYTIAYDNREVAFKNLKSRKTQ